MPPLLDGLRCLCVRALYSPRRLLPCLFPCPSFCARLRRARGWFCRRCGTPCQDHAATNIIARTVTNTVFSFFLASFFFIFLNAFRVKKTVRRASAVPRPQAISGFPLPIGYLNNRPANISAYIPADSVAIYFKIFSSSDGFYFVVSDHKLQPDRDDPLLSAGALRPPMISLFKDIHRLPGICRQAAAGPS